MSYPYFLKYSLFLLIITLSLFFIVYFYFSGTNYYDNSLKANTLILPILYAGTVLYEYLYTPDRSHLYFKQIFKYSFLTMFVAGSISLIFIFIFFNYIDPGAGKILAYQQLNIRLEGVENYIKNNPKATDLKNAKTEANFLKQTIKDNYNLFNYKMFLISSSCILLFYLVISLLYASFLQKK